MFFKKSEIVKNRKKIDKLKKERDKLAKKTSPLIQKINRIDNEIIKITGKNNEVNKFFPEKYWPLLEKSIINVALVTAHENINDNDIIEKSFLLFIETLPLPIRMFFPKKAALEFLLLKKDHLLKIINDTRKEF